MSTKPDFDTTKRIRFKLRARLAIRKLEQSAAYRAKLEAPSCEQDTPEGLVNRSFRYRGKGRETDLTVTCHAKVMVGLLKAMLKTPTIQVTASSESAYSGSYRTWDIQYGGWYEYKYGDGHKFAHPCSGYHRQGRALDLRLATEDETEAMESVRVDGLRFYHGDVFGDDPHWTLGALG